jgi:hypothetical protein
VVYVRFLMNLILVNHCFGSLISYQSFLFIFYFQSRTFGPISLLVPLLKCRIGALLKNVVCLFCVCMFINSHNLFR